MTRPVGTDVVFFDIGDTLASARLGPGGSGLELTVLPGVLDALEGLREADARIGILSDRGSVPASEVEEALRRADLWRFLKPELVLYGRKDTPAVFESAAEAARAGSARPPRRVLFVGEDAAERAVAQAADLDVCPAPVLVRAVLDGRPLRYLRLRVPPAFGGDWAPVLRELPVVVLHTSAFPSAAVELYAVADDATALDLDDRGFWVDRLGADDEPEASDLYILRNDALEPAAVGEPTGGGRATFDTTRGARRVLASTQEGLVVAVPAGRSVDALHVGTPRHGHNLKLTPLPTLLDPLARERLITGPATAGLADDTLPPLGTQEAEIIAREVRTDELAADVDRFQGAAPLDDAGAVVSRHVAHPDNARAVRALVSTLSQLGLAVSTHRFLHQGRPLDNVEAVLGGRDLPGVVLVTAHLDSTASRDLGYRPDRDPAPGADDDGSGVAGVLAVARAVLALDAELAPPRREVRFVLFNAEEQGLVGSRSYARDQAVRGEDILGVLQLDMIGFDGAPGRTFELHVGFSGSEHVEEGSRRLAELVAAQRARVAPDLEEPQTYPGPDGAADPAEQRSDHYSFQLHGYPAVLASEDFFAGPDTTSPDPDPNPNYHSPEDLTVDYGYAADIARLVTAAAWLSATR